MEEPRLDKDYYSLKEVATLVGLKRHSLYPYYTRLNIALVEFSGHRDKYVQRQDVLRVWRDKHVPWKNQKEADA